MFPEQIKYGGFWRRFAAFWVDFLCLAPLTLLALWANDRYRLFTAYYFIPGQLFGLFYSVYLVRRFGGTPGKLVVGLRIRRTNGEPAGYREAFLRYLPELLLTVPVTLALVYATFSITDAEYHALGFVERSLRLTELAPSWLRPFQIAQQVWLGSEFIVLLTNRKRRAIHDFIAGTVVIVQNHAPAPTVIQRMESSDRIRSADNP